MRFFTNFLSNSALIVLLALLISVPLATQSLVRYRTPANKVLGEAVTLELTDGLGELTHSQQETRYTLKLVKSGVDYLGSVTIVNLLGADKVFMADVEGFSDLNVSPSISFSLSRTASVNLAKNQACSLTVKLSDPDNFITESPQVVVVVTSN